MFDLDAGKLLIVGIVALLVVGPKDLPHVLRAAGQVVARIRRIGAEFQARFADAIKEADLDGVKKDFGAIGDQVAVNIAVNPLTAMRGHLTTAINGAKAAITPPRGAPAAAEPTYASPEMREYLALSTPPSLAEAEGKGHGHEEAVGERTVPSAEPRRSPIKRRVLARRAGRANWPRPRLD